MSVYIKGMEMPKSCHECPLVDTLMTCPCMKMPGKDFWDSVLLEFARHEDCPLINVPDHGRLIDADALIDKIAENMDKARKADNYDWWDKCTGAWDFIMPAPTIIPADKDGAE